ncbi:NADPH-dependent 2,4-dienoyl-CoA reductase, sulfur reductase, or a related oxidoreductase, partial [Geosmithia morbida]
MGSIPENTPRVRVFIAGGCYAGLSTAMNLLDLCRGQTPRMSRGEPYAHRDEYADKAWVRYADIPSLQPSHLPEGSTVTVLHGSVTGVDPSSKTASVLESATGQTTSHAYDYLVSTTGLRRVWPVVPQSTTKKAYLAEANGHIDAVARARHGVVVVGGGAVGIEMAAELKLVKPDVDVTLAHSRDKLLSSEGLSDECKDTAADLLREGGVSVLTGHRLASKTEVADADGVRYQLEFTNGHTMPASQVIMAMSNSVPATEHLPADVLDPEGYVRILPNLSLPASVPNAGSHFCGGDAVLWSGIKRCGGAMHHGHYMAVNIHQSILASHIPGYEAQFLELQEVPPMIGLAVGKKAVAYGPDVGTVSGEDVMYSYFRDDLGFD